MTGLYTFGQIFSGLKTAVKKLLQRTLGFQKYLRVFARFKIKTLKLDRKEGDFFHFMSLLPDSGLILDIGANLGIMTWHLLKRFKGAEIWAFEPIPDNLEVLRHVTAGLGSSRLKIFDIALGDQEGTTTMIMPEIDEVHMQGLSHVVHESIEDFNMGRTFDVQIKKLDALVKSDQKVTGIKLDVENFEYFVLKGGEEMLKRDHPVIYTELWDNLNRKQCMSFLRKLGYEAKYLHQSKLKNYKPSDYSGQNFFFIHTENT